MHLEERLRNACETGTMTDSETREYYRWRAPEYEQIYYRDMPERRQEIDDEADFLRGLASGREVLDLACGTGYWTQVVANSASMVVGADYWPEMIRQARAKEYGKSPLFVQADIGRLPFVEGSFDLIVLGFWLSHQSKETLDRFLETVCRPLRRGGLIWTTDNNPPAEGSEMHSVTTDAHGNHFKRRWLDDGREFVILKNYFGRDELAELVGSRFEIERLVYKKYYWSLLLRPKQPGGKG